LSIDFNPENCVVSVNVSDYDRSLAWYRDVLGFEVAYLRGGLRVVRLRMV
jgi:catechol 2,3-dioxygenase-like lactoylglutathione lyase family enzyme